MADKPFRLRVLEAITEQLQTIQRTAGPTTGPYTYDLADAVFRGRAAYGQNDPLPMVAILEDPKELDQEAVPINSDVGKGDWRLLIQGFIRDDSVHPTDPAYYLLADVKAALQTANIDRNILGLGGKKPTITTLHIGSGVVRPPDDLSVVAYFWLPIRLCLVEDADNAFT